MSWPDIHGDRVVFTAEGDLWLGDVNTLEARRITSNTGVKSQARFAPDGKEIAFESDYDGFPSVYRMKLDGEPAERLTSDLKPALFLNDFSPDGKDLLIGYPTDNPFAATLAWINVRTHETKTLPFEMASFSSVGPDGKIALTRVEQTWQAWFGYKGGQVNPIWYGDPKTMQFKKIYSSSGSNEYPAIANGRVYFCQDFNGGFEIRSVKLDGSDPKLNAGPYDVPVQYLHGDGHRLVYMKGPGLEMLDLATGKTKPLPFHLVSDQPHSRPALVSAESFVQNMNLAPDGKRVLVETRGQIVSIPVKDGAARVVLAHPGVRYRKAVLSPDKKQLAFVSDASGEEEIYVGDSEGKKAIPWTHEGNRQITELRWSPNSKFLTYSDSYFETYVLTPTGQWPLGLSRAPFTGVPVYDISPDGAWIVAQESNPRTMTTSISLIELSTHKKTPVPVGVVEAGAPCFSRDGHWIGFIGGGELAPAWDPLLNQMDSNAKSVAFLLALRADEKSPFLTKSDDDGESTPDAKKADDKDKSSAVKIDLPGLAQRLVQVPAPPDNYGEIQIVGDRVLLVTDSALKYYDLKARKGGTITPLSPLPVVPDWSFRSIHLSADGSKVLVFGPAPHVVSATDDDAKLEATLIHFGQLKIEVSPPHEWHEIFEDTWRTIRDNYYADNLNGINWPAMRSKYEKLVPLVRDRSDLNYIIRWLQSEMNTGHMYTGYQDVRVRPRVASAFLGIDWTPDSGFLKITRILRGNGYIKPSPLAAPGIGVKEGDYLIEVAGTPAVPGADVSQGLRGRVGEPVELKVNSKPSAEGARSILVEPIPSETLLRYYDWVEANRQYVDRKSGGKLGYIHMYAMEQPNFADFVRQYLPQSDKEGLVIDIRFNGGGNLAGPLTAILARKVLMWGHIRNSAEYMGRDWQAFLGHQVCLVNEHSYSEGEGFPFYFRAAKLGPIFGKRTWGGYVGSDPPWPLIDGSFVEVSHYGGWTPKEGWVIEGTGIVPDKEVENDPSLFAKGIDSQLDAAIDYLLKKAKEEPVVFPDHPPFPVKALRGEKPGTPVSH